MKGGWGIKIRFFNYRKIEWNCVIFCEKLSISPISKLNVNLNFQKWITCWEDFRNFEKIIFCFPHSTSICKFDHYYLLEIWVSFWRFYLNFGEFPPYLTLKYISKMKLVLHMGDLIQKNDFFLLCFFQFHQHVVTFSSKNYVKMKSPIVKTITKNSSKIEKIMKFFHRFSNVWHEFDKKNQRFYWKFTYG